MFVLVHSFILLGYGPSIDTILPPLGTYFLDLEINDFILGNPYCVLRVPDTQYEESQLESNRLGQTFISKDNKFLNYLYKTRFLDKERLWTYMMIGDMSEAFLDNLLHGRLDYLYRFSVVDRIPSHLHSLLACTPH